VPAGFEIQLFASEPMINKPINHQGGVGVDDDKRVVAGFGHTQGVVDDIGVTLTNDVDKETSLNLFQQVNGSVVVTCCRSRTICTIGKRVRTVEQLKVFVGSCRQDVGHTDIRGVGVQN
jgi:hypothetical protein